MAKRHPSVIWTERFNRVAMTASNPDEWHYTRLSLKCAVTAFNELGLLGYQLDIKAAVWRENVGKYEKKGKCPGCYFRVVRK